MRSIATEAWRLSNDKGSLPILKDTISTPKLVGERTFEFTISTASTDRHGDQIPVNSWDVKAYRSNPVVMFGHNTNALPVGKMIDIYEHGDTLRGQIQFATADQNPFADQVFRNIKAGFLKGASVGFLPRAYSPIATDKGSVAYKFTDCELLEVSVVPVPANADCVARSMRAIGMGGDDDDGDDWYSEEETENLIRAALDVPIPEPDFNDRDWYNEAETEALIRGALDAFDYKYLGRISN